jgi:hypothetical protein
MSKMDFIERKRGSVMNYKELAEKAREIKADGERFLARYENEIVDFLRADAEGAEDRLQKEIVFEFLDNLHGMCHMAEYMEQEVIKEGILGVDARGEVTLDGEVLPLMTEVEVKLYDKEEKQEIWTRTYVAGAKKRYLVGVDRTCPLNGIRARMRG